MTSHRNDDGLTGLELIILFSFVIIATAFLLVYLSGSDTTNRGRTFASGLIADSICVSGDHLQPVGNLYGFPALSRTYGSSPVIIRNEDPDQLGITRLVVSLFMGDTGAIDMDRVQVRWIQSADQEILMKTPSYLLVCPNWTISRKYNLLPGRTADADNWLEPGEQFELLICPSEGVRPYGMFTLVIKPDGTAEPLSLGRTVPFRIDPVMNLG
jgi:hypothetical protein